MNKENLLASSTELTYNATVEWENLNPTQLSEGCSCAEATLENGEPCNLTETALCNLD